MFYIEQLVRHAQPQLKEKHPRKKLLQNLQPLAKILRDLEVDLRTNPNDSWVQEFVNTPNHGHVALIDLIKDLADNPYSVPRKNPRKYTVLEREPVSLFFFFSLCTWNKQSLGWIAVYSCDVLVNCSLQSYLYTALLCLKALTSHRVSWKCVTHSSAGP